MTRSLVCHRAKQQLIMTHCLSQGQATAKVMSPAEMAEYEEKKLKMRKAMGENLHDDVQGRQFHALH